MSQLLPEGIEHLGDAPFTLHGAIRHALRILKYEEYPIEERPPKGIWFDGEKLNAHWEKVEGDRRAQFGGRAASDDDDPDYAAEGSYDENAVELIKRG